MSTCRTRSAAIGGGSASGHGMNRHETAAHFIEHMPSRGRHSTRLRAGRAHGRHRRQVNAYTTREGTCYYSACSTST
ncbi:MAG: hypothetical protein ACLRRN_08405 [Oscillospiraceae bacterium]